MLFFFTLQVIELDILQFLSEDSLLFAQYRSSKGLSYPLKLFASNPEQSYWEEGANIVFRKVFIHVSNLNIFPKVFLILCLLFVFIVFLSFLCPFFPTANVCEVRSVSCPFIDQPRTRLLVSSKRPGKAVCGLTGQICHWIQNFGQ